MKMKNLIQKVIMKLNLFKKVKLKLMKNIHEYQHGMVALTINTHGHRILQTLQYKYL